MLHLLEEELEKKLDDWSIFEGGTESRRYVLPDDYYQLLNGWDPLVEKKW